MAIANYTDDNGINWVRITTNEDDAGYFWVNWREKGWDLANKTTTIEWACGVYCKYTFQNNAVRMDAFSINGVQVYSGGTYSNFKKEISHTIATGTLDVEHDADGTKTLSISKITGWLYLNHNFIAEASEHPLTTLCAASITEADDFTDDRDSISITIHNPGGFPINVWLDPNIIGDCVCGRDNFTLGENGTYIWEFSQDEMNELRNQCSGKECPVRIYVETTIDGNYYTSYKDVTFTLKSDAVKPVVNCSVIPDNTELADSFKDLFIQGKSKAHIDVKAEGKYGADIVSCYATMDDKTYEGEEIYTDVIKGSGDITITVRVEDERGFYTEVAENIEVIPYSKPLVVPVGDATAILCYRSDGNGKRVGNSTSLWIKAAVSYHEVIGETGENVNACKLQWRRKLASEQWDDDNKEHAWIDLTEDDTYNELVTGIFDLTESYTVQIRAIDTIGEQDPKTFDIPTRDVPLHLGKGGMNVTIGEYCDYSEERTFRSTWKAIFAAGVDIFDGDSRMTLADYIKSVINEGG